MSTDAAKANAALEVHPSNIMIQIQSELAELYVRRWERWPLQNSPRPKSAK